MNKKTIFGILAIFVLMVSSSAVYAFGPRSSGDYGTEARTALDNEDFEEWKEIISSELTEDNFEMALKRHTHREEVRGNRGAVTVAIESEDYDAYVEAIQNCERMQGVSKENFDILIEAHQAMESGDHETARGLRESIGVINRYKNQGSGRGFWK